MCSQNKVTVKKRFRVKSSLPFKNTITERSNRPSDPRHRHSTHMHDAVNSKRNDMPVLPPFSYLS